MTGARLAVRAVAIAAGVSVAACSGSGSGGGGGGGGTDRGWKPGSCTTTAPAATGPGDAGNHLPLSAGSTWTYEVAERADATAPVVRQRAHVRIDGTRPVSGFTATVAAVTDFDDPAAAASEVLLSKRAAGVVRIPNDATDRLSTAIGPFEVVEFPLDPGRAFVQTSCNDLDLAVDVDRDGLRDRVDYHAEVTVAGDETVTVAAGTFVARRVDTRMWTAIQTSSSGSYASESLQQDWYAPGVGAVRTVVEDPASGFRHEERLLGYTVDGAEGGLLELRTLATGLSQADSNTEQPGRPGIAFDGSGHLLATVSAPGGYAQDAVRAYPIAADGTVGAPVQAFVFQGQGFRPSVAFNGTSHLVVSAAMDTSSAWHLVGQRVSPAGAPLDGGGFEIPGTGQTVYAPVVASDGDGWLVVRTEYQVAGLRATRVGADGAVLGDVVLGAPWSSRAASPAVAYGGGSYLVAWAEDGVAIRGVRVAPDGTVLDAAPIAISEFPSPKAMGAVAWDGTRFLVTWSDARRDDLSGPGYLAFDVYAARVAADGTVLDPAGIEVNAFPGLSKADPSVAAIEGGFAVVWWSSDVVPEAGVHAARVSGDGVLLDAPASGPGVEIVSVRTASYPVHPVVVPAAGGRTLVVWAQNDEAAGHTKSIRAAVLAW